MSLQPYTITMIDQTTGNLQSYGWDGSIWIAIGNPLNLSGVTFPTVVYITDNKVVVVDNASKRLKAYKYNSPNWTQLGTSSIAFSSMGDSCLASVYPNRLAVFGDSLQKVIEYDFNDTYFSQVGSQFAYAGIVEPDITGMDFNKIALIDDSFRLLKCLSFNGSVWAQVGSSLSIASIVKPSITALTSTRIALIDQTVQTLRAYDFNGSTWSLFGTPLSIAGIASPSITAIDSDKVAFFDTTNKQLRVYQLIGTTWTLVGTGFSIAGATVNPDICGVYKPFALNCYHDNTVPWQTSE
jgi:hypothetical protein